jgi:hypothetical protein
MPLVVSRLMWKLATAPLPDAALGLCSTTRYAAASSSRVMTATIFSWPWRRRRLIRPLGDEAAEQDERAALRREGVVGLHAVPEFFVDPLDHVRRADCLPLLHRERAEGQEIVALLVEALDGSGAPLVLLLHEGVARRCRSVEPRRVYDQVVVVGDFVMGVLRRLAQDVPELVHGAALDLRRPPRERDRAVQASLPVNDADAAPSGRGRSGPGENPPTPYPARRRRPRGSRAAWSRRRGRRLRPARAGR